MERKSFFRERTAADIRKLELGETSKQRGLVERIADLETGQGLVIRAQIIPGRFFQNVETTEDAARKCYKHGDLVSLSYPETKEDARRCPNIPLAIRAQALSRLQDIREDEINFVGLVTRPNWGDRLRRVTPFVACPEGLRIFAYAETMTAYLDREGKPQRGIKIESYADARRVREEGASMVAEVPSRTAKHPRYKFKLMHVPVIRSPENLATVMTLKPELMQNPLDGEPIKGRTPHSMYNIRYTWERESEGSEVVTYQPHDVAAYVKIAGNFWKSHNMTPMEMNPFILVSKVGAEFYKKLCNNVVIFDPTSKSKEHLRKPYLAEKSILLARAIGRFGHDEFAFWNPERDRKLKEYDWTVR